MYLVAKQYFTELKNKGSGAAEDLLKDYEQLKETNGEFVLFDLLKCVEIKKFNNKEYLLETSLTADFSLIKAWKADTMGNLIYRHTAMNFNPMMASAAKITIAEVEQIVEPGTLDPDQIMTPGIFVKRIVIGEKFEKRIERRTVREQ